MQLINPIKINNEIILNNTGNYYFFNYENFIDGLDHCKDRKSDPHLRFFSENRIKLIENSITK